MWFWSIGMALSKLCGFQRKRKGRLFQFHLRFRRRWLKPLPLTPMVARFRCFLQQRRRQMWGQPKSWHLRITERFRWRRLRTTRISRSRSYVRIKLRGMPTAGVPRFYLYGTRLERQKDLFRRFVWGYSDFGVSIGSL